MAISYFDVWKKRMENNGDIVQSRLNNSKNIFNNSFKDDPSYRLAKLKIKSNIEEIELDIRLANDENNPLKKKILVRPDIVIEVGDYITYKEKSETKIHLVLSVEENLISPLCNTQECNHLLKWKNDEDILEALCIANNQTKYTEGIKNENVGVTEVSAMFLITLPYTEITQTIKNNQRLMLNGNAWRVTQVDYTTNKGLVTLLLGKDSVNEETDNIKLGICDYWEAKKHTYIFNIPPNVEISKDSSFNLLYSIVNELGQDIDYSKVSIATDSNLITINNVNGVISIIGNDIGTGNIKISVSLNNKLEEKIIPFEVKSTIINKLNYQPVWSNGTVLYLSSSTTLTVNKYDNNYKIPCNIEYTIDSNGQALLNNKKIDIKVKSANSVWIKNTKCVDNEEFFINIVDKDSVDKTAILSTKIQLKGVE